MNKEVIKLSFYCGLFISLTTIAIYADKPILASVSGVIIGLFLMSLRESEKIYQLEKELQRWNRGHYMLGYEVPKNGARKV